MNANHLLFALGLGLSLLPTEPIVAQSQDGPPDVLGNVPEEMLLQQLVSITQNPRLRDELEIIDKQTNELAEVLREYQQERQQFMSENRKDMELAQQAAREGMGEVAQEMMRELQSEMREKSAAHFKRVNKILLPHQIKRIRQIALQMMLKHASGSGDEFGMPLALADHLGLSQKEKETLKQTIEDARREFAEELEALKDSSRNKILKAIPAEKRKEYHALIGDLFDLEQSIRASEQMRRNAERQRHEQLQRERREQQQKERQRATKK